VAAIRAAEVARWIESFLWFLPVLRHPHGGRDPARARRRLLLVVLLRRWVLAAWADSGAVAGAPRVGGDGAGAVLRIPGFARVENYHEHDMEINDLALWARSSTPESAVFLFPDAGASCTRHFPAGWRCAQSTWMESGARANTFPMSPASGGRVASVMAPRFQAGTPGRYASYGVDYVVVRNGSVYWAQRVR